MLIIAGKNDIAVHGLELALSFLPKEKVAVVCNRNESGADEWQRSLRKAAQFHGVKEISLEEAYVQANILFLSLEFDRIVVPEKFSIKNVFNIHFSLLPKYKGMFTSVWPLLNYESHSGVTLHRIDQGIDTGGVVDQCEFEILPWWVSRDLYFAYTNTAIKVLARNFSDLIAGQSVSSPQDSVRSTYYSAGSIVFSEVKLPVKKTAWEIQQYIRAFSFREYQFLRFDGEAVVSATLLSTSSGLKAGEVVCKKSDSVVVSTIDYDIELYFDRLDSLLESCRENDVSSVRRLLPNCAGYNDAGSHGWTPLIVACYAGSLEVVKYLVGLGADVNRPNRKGTTPLMYAKDAYFSGRCKKIFTILVKHGADLEHRDAAGKKLKEYVSTAQYKELLVSLTHAGDL